jgi:hypothetical protein
VEFDICFPSSLLAFAAPEEEIDRVETTPGFDFRALTEYYAPRPSRRGDWDL